MAKKNKEAENSEETAQNEGATATAEAQEEHAHEHVHGEHCDHDHEEGPEPILIELDDLSPEGKAKAEKQLHRKIADVAYEVAAPRACPEAVQALDFTITRDVYQAEQRVLLQDLQKEATLPGFRKGKAPIALLQRRMGEDSIRHTIASLATNALRQEHAAKNYQFVAKPRIVKFDVAGDGPITFTAEIEAMPEVELKTYKGMTVQVEERPVDEEAVAQRLDSMRRQNSVLEVAPADATVAEDSVVLLDTEVTNERGEPLQHLSQADKQVYNIKSELPEEVANELIGKKAGESFETTVTHTVTNRRGEEVEHKDTYKVTLKEIKASKLPELDDEFAKDLGEYQSLQELKDKIRTDLEKAEADRQRSEAIGKLFRELVEQNPVDAPRSLLAHRQYELIMQDSYQMQRYGLRLEQVIQDTDAYLREQRASAEEMVKIQLLTGKLAELENLQATDEDVDQAIAKTAEESGRKPLAVRARLEAQKQLDQFRSNVARNKLADYLLANNKVEKVAPAAEAAAEGEAEAEAEAPKKKSPKKKASEE